MKTLDPIFHRFCVDGSFITNKELPSDIDITLELPAPTVPLLQTIVASGVLAHDAIRNHYMIDIYATFGGGVGNDFRAFFQYLRPEDAQDRGLQPGAVKGILRLVL